jgi:hypothetical protein
MYVHFYNVAPKKLAGAGLTMMSGILILTKSSGAQSAETLEITGWAA